MTTVNPFSILLTLLAPEKLSKSTNSALCWEQANFRKPLKACISTSLILSTGQNTFLTGSAEDKQIL